MNHQGHGVKNQLDRIDQVDMIDQSNQSDLMDQAAPMIALSNMTAMLSNGEVLLKEVSFDLPQGAKLAVIGANGSGKSTLMRGLLGMIPTDVEDYRIAGSDVMSLSLIARAKLMSYIGQQITPEAETTVWEWCQLSRYPYQTSKEENEEIIIKALEACDVLAFVARKLMSLSGGERQRVYLAGVLAQETPIIVLDEVNSALDPKYREAMNHLIASLHDKTVISVTHDINSLNHYSHILALKKGAVIAFGPREEILNQALLTTLFDYDFTEIWHEKVARYFLNILLKERSHNG